jgi:hypothetical protein
MKKVPLSGTHIAKTLNHRRVAYLAKTASGRGMARAGARTKGVGGYQYKARRATGRK